MKSPNCQLDSLKRESPPFLAVLLLPTSGAVPDSSSSDRDHAEAAAAAPCCTAGSTARRGQKPATRAGVGGAVSAMLFEHGCSTRAEEVRLAAVSTAPPAAAGLGRAGRSRNGAREVKEMMDKNTMASKTKKKKPNRT